MASAKVEKLPVVGSKISDVEVMVDVMSGGGRWYKKMKSVLEASKLALGNHPALPRLLRSFKDGEVARKDVVNVLQVASLAEGVVPEESRRVYRRMAKEAIERKMPSSLVLADGEVVLGKDRRISWLRDGVAIGIKPGGETLAMFGKVDRTSVVEAKNIGDVEVDGKLTVRIDMNEKVGVDVDALGVREKVQADFGRWAPKLMKSPEVKKLIKMSVGLMIVKGRGSLSLEEREATHKGLEMIANRFEALKGEFARRYDSGIRPDGEDVGFSAVWNQKKKGAVMVGAAGALVFGASIAVETVAQAKEEGGVGDIEIEEASAMSKEMGVEKSNKITTKVDLGSEAIKMEESDFDLDLTANQREEASNLFSEIQGMSAEASISLLIGTAFFGSLSDGKRSKFLRTVGLVGLGATILLSTTSCGPQEQMGEVTPAEVPAEVVPVPTIDARDVNEEVSASWSELTPEEVGEEVLSFREGTVAHYDEDSGSWEVFEGNQVGEGIVAMDVAVGGDKLRLIEVSLNGGKPVLMMKSEDGNSEHGADWVMLKEGWSADGQYRMLAIKPDSPVFAINEDTRRVFFYDMESGEFHPFTGGKDEAPLEGGQGALLSLAQVLHGVDLSSAGEMMSEEEGWNFHWGDDGEMRAIDLDSGEVKLHWDAKKGDWIELPEGLKEGEYLISEDGKSILSAEGKEMYVLEMQVGDDGSESEEWVRGTIDLPENLGGVQEKLGDYRITESEGVEGYQLLDAEGSMVEGVRFFEDGATELMMEVDGEAVTLVTGLEAVSAKEGKLTWGLWDYENGEWSGVNSKTAAEMASELESGEENPHKLVVVEGHAKEKEMIDTIFLARDEAMAGYDREEEFRGITVKGVENFDNTPLRYRFINMARLFAGNGNDHTYIFSPITNGTDYRDRTPYSYARPIQPIVKGSGYFGVEVVSENGEKMELVLVPIVAKNADGSLTNMAGLISRDDFREIAPYLTPEERGHVYVDHVMKTVVQVPEFIKDADFVQADEELMEFMAEVNRENLFKWIKEPEVDGSYNVSVLPKEVERALVTIMFDETHN